MLVIQIYGLSFKKTGWFVGCWVLKPKVGLLGYLEVYVMMIFNIDMLNVWFLFPTKKTYIIIIVATSSSAPSYPPKTPQKGETEWSHMVTLPDETSSKSVFGMIRPSKSSILVKL